MTQTGVVGYVQFLNLILLLTHPFSMVLLPLSWHLSVSRVEVAIEVFGDKGLLSLESLLAMQDRYVPYPIVDL